MPSKGNLKNAPTTKPAEYQYSNLGYMIAGSMAERVTGESWESLMQKRLFEPLGMKSAGFGPPGTHGRTDEPLGHVKSDGKWVPKYHDNAEALGPAGRVHCSLQDWARFAALQLPASEPKILDRKILNELLNPTGRYAAGWNIAQRPWAKGMALNHGGSNTMWFAIVWVAPKLNRTFIAVTNSADDKSAGICDKTISQLIRIDAANRVK